MIEYRALREEELVRSLFSAFVRRQVVNNCYRREEGQWVIRSAPFVDEWSESDYEFLVVCLRHTVSSGGLVLGAFDGGELKGFASVEAERMGKNGEYLDLTSIHVSEDRRGKGIGKELFLAVKDWAKAQGAAKLYISSHSAVETQAFYEAMGCVDAKEVQMHHVKQEPYDRQLECVL